MATKKISELEAINAAEDNDVLVIVDTSESTTNKITKGNLLIGAGHTIEMTLNENYQIVLVLKNAAGTALSTQTIDLPNENAVTNLAYNNGILTITKQSGATSQINLTGLIEGLVTENDFNTFKEALQTTLEAINEKDAEQDEAIAENYKVINKLNEKLENQQKVIDQLPQVTGQGTSITLENTIEAQFTKFDVEGNSTQETTDGRQLFNIEDYTQIALGNNGGASNIKTINKITVTTSSSSTSSGIYITKENLISYITNYDSNTQYHLSMNVKTNRKLNLQIGCDTRPILSVEGTTRISVETSINTNGLVIYSKNQTEGDNIEITEIMVSTSSNTEYEHYTGGIASPNPNYEQPIKSAGDNENLFDYVNNLNPSIAGLKSVINKDGSITTTGIPTYNNTIIVNVNITSLLINGQTYTFSQKYSQRNKLYLQLITINKITQERTYLNLIDATSRTFTANTETLNYYLYLQTGTIAQWGTSSLTITNEYKLEKGNKASGYSPYGMGSINEKIQNKNLFNKNTITEGKFIDNNGNLANDSSNFAGDFIKLLSINSNLSYHISATTGRAKRIAYYDNSKTFISRQLISTTQGKLNIPENASYVRLSCYNDDLESLQLEIIEEGSTATPYVEHKEQDYSIFVQQPMRSIGDVRDCFVNVNGNWFERHYITRNYLKDYSYYFATTTDGNLFRIVASQLLDIKKIQQTLMCNIFIGIPSSTNRTNGNIYYNSYAGVVDIICNDYDNETDFKAMAINKNGYFDCILAEPQDLPCTEEQIQQLENLPSTYKDFTIIQSQDETEAYLEVSGIRDINTMFDKVTNAIVSLGGNV